MAARATMASLITRVRVLINDTLPAGSGQIFDDTTIQDVMDVSRIDYRNEPLRAVPTFSGATISYLDYYHQLGDWEDSPVLKQYLVTTVTPSVSEPIVGHWQFAATTFPPVMINGSVHDVYRAAADLLERWAAKWALLYHVSVDGQSLHREQTMRMLLALAKSYRMKQRPRMMSFARTDLNVQPHNVDLGPRNIDYIAKG